MPQVRLMLAMGVCCVCFACLGALLGAILRVPGFGLCVGLLFGMAYTVFGAWGSERFALESWKAQLLDQSAAPNLYEMLRELSERVEIPLPTLYHVPHPAPNAFVIAGRDGESAIAVTDGLTRHLQEDEVQAVMALMVARLATGAMADWTIAAALAGMPLYGARRLAVLLPPGAALLRLACADSIILAADGHAAHLSAAPQTLVAALGKIAAAVSAEDEWVGNPATSLLFAVSPFARFTRTWPGLPERLGKLDLHD